MQSIERGCVGVVLMSRDLNRQFAVAARASVGGLDYILF
jgi:hypothetical protein